jgi:hypothetical protein
VGRLKTAIAPILRGRDYDGEIVKMTLDGQIVGKFGRAGKLLKEFGRTSINS